MDQSQPKIYDDPKVDDIASENGVIDTLATLSLDIPDRDIIEGLDSRIQDSNDYWNSGSGFNLNIVRAENQRLYMGKHMERERLYRHQIPYIENQIYVGLETVISYVTSQIPQPEVYPAQDTQASKILSQDIEKVIFAHSEKFDLSRKIESAVRDMLLKRIGVLKLRFDPNYGQFGEIVPEVVNPEHIIVDKNVKLGENPAFICHILKDSIENICARFPDKKEDIYKCFGIKRGTPKQLSQIVAYREVWCTYNKDGEALEGVVWYVEKLVLGKDLNPNWDWDERRGDTIRKNFLEMPAKPFLPFNYINDGTHWIDQITPVEQAAPQQEMLNKRGRQIMENADKANPYQIFSGKALSSDDAANLTGDTNQKILLDTEDVRSAVTQIQPNLLPNYVIDDKFDLRQTVHSILGTPPQLRGEGEGSDTLGQDLIARNQAMGRQESIVRSIELAMGNYFKYLVQMMKIFYTDDHYYTAVGEDGAFDRIAMNQDKIEDGVDIRVKAGSTLPFDKARAESVAINLAKLNLIDPLSLYEDLHMNNVQKRFERLVKYQVDPTLLAEDLKDEEADRDAYIDFTTIMGGKYAPPREDVTVEHIRSHREQLLSAEFKQSDPEKQSMLMEHIRAENEVLAEQAALLASQEPPPQQGMPGMGGESELGMQPGMAPPTDGVMPGAVPGGGGGNEAAPLPDAATAQPGDMSDAATSPLM